MRVEKGVVPTMKRVDTCAAEFEAVTPYLYSSYDGDCECAPTTSKKVWPFQCSLLSLSWIFGS